MHHSPHLLCTKGATKFPNDKLYCFPFFLFLLFLLVYKMSASTHYEDTVSVDDVIDLNQDCSSSSDGRSTSQHHYRISLHSIDDDELRLFRRDLVTPAPSVCGGDDVDVIKRNMIRGRFVPPSRIQRPVSRGESVMLFKKINNGSALYVYFLFYTFEKGLNSYLSKVMRTYRLMISFQVN